VGGGGHWPQLADGISEPLQMTVRVEGVSGPWNELARNSQRGAINQLSRRGVEVLLWSRSDTEHHPWEFVSPVGTREPSLERCLHAAVESLNDPVCLRVVGCGPVQVGTEQRGHIGPELGRELRAPV
jgi:hypothetical protein